MKKNNLKTNKVLFSATLLLAIGGLIFSASCKKEDFDFEKLSKQQEYSPEVAVPLVNSNLSLSDLLTDFDSEHIVTDEDNFVSLIYKSNFYKEYANTLYKIPNQNINITQSASLPDLPTPGDSAEVPLTKKINFTAQNNGRYDSVMIKGGTMTLSLNSTINRDIKIFLRLPELTKDGIPYTKTIDYKYNASSPLSINEPISMEGYQVNFDQTNEDNALNIEMTFTAYYSTNPNNSPYDFNFGFGFNNIQYDILYGLLGLGSFDVDNDTVGVSLFNNALEGNFSLSDPRIKILTYNSIGMPIQVNFNQIEAIGNSGSVILSGSGIDNPFIIGSPTLDQIGETIKDSLYLNKDNSNIAEAFNNSPKKIGYSIGATSNPAGTNAYNFIMDTSSYIVDVEVDLPLWGKGDNFVIQDTFAFGFDNIDEVQELEFKMNSINGFPIDANVQFYFTDSLYNRLDSLVKDGTEIIQAGTVNGAPDYRVISSTEKATTFIYERNSIENLFSAKYMIIRAQLNTAKEGTVPVKIFSDYELNVKLGARVKAKMTF